MVFNREIQAFSQQKDFLMLWMWEMTEYCQKIAFFKTGAGFWTNLHMGSFLGPESIKNLFHEGNVPIINRSISTEGNKFVFLFDGGKM